MAALLLIDIQNDFCPPSGALAVPGGTEVVAVANSLRASGRFAHTRAYVESIAMAVGRYSLVSYEEIIPRVEFGKPVPGHIFVFSRDDI